MTLGLVCDACDALSPVHVPSCVGCGKPLGVLSSSSRAATSRPLRGSAAVLETAPLAPSVENPVIMRACTKCGAHMPTLQRFCGNCGGRIDPPSSPGSSPGAATGASTGASTGSTGKTQFFSAMQQTGRAKLI